MKKISFLIVIFGALISSAFAQLNGNPANFCRNGSFPTDSDEFNLGYIKAKKGERIYFYSDGGKCPKGKNCRLKTYLVNGNEVLTSRTYGNFVCAWYETKKGSEVVGWLPIDKVEFPVFLSQKYEPWIGDWKFYDNNLQIKRIKETEDFQVSGNAFWKGLSDNIHIGEIDAKGALNESIIKLKQDDCEMKLDLVIHYLVVSDNLKCGGANVTFSGVYRRFRR
jgi:hypothetical protein